MKLPSGKFVYSSTPIYPGSNFTWGEVTKNCTRHIQDLIIDNVFIKSALQIEITIIETAKKLDQIREQFGSRPIYVNSWYRPSHINTRVGGSKFSRHQFGDAVDIRSNYLSPSEVKDRLNDHVGGLSSYYGFVHIDWRGKKARW
jgi:uncharacterized protein YcbK (DUF882 family)